LPFLEGLKEEKKSNEQTSFSERGGIGSLLTKGRVAGGGEGKKPNIRR